MSQRISITSIDLNELTQHFGSKDEDTLRRIAELLHRQSGNPVLDIAVRALPAAADEYDYDVFVAARSIIMGDMTQGQNASEESNVLINAVFILADLQERELADMEYNGDWKNYASIEYQEAMAPNVDLEINRYLSYLAYGRPFFTNKFDHASADEYYSYLTLGEVTALYEYMRAHTFTTEDEDGFGKDLLGGLASLVAKRKDLWLTVF